MERPQKDHVFIEMARILSQRGSCRRLAVGAIIVKKTKHIIASGVNGPNTWDCEELRCDLGKPCEHAIHAEENAIRFAKEERVSLVGATLYCTHMPCIDCAKLILQSGISRVVYKEAYRKREGVELLIQNNIDVCQFLK